MKKFLTALAISSLITGCQSVDVTKTAKGSYDATDANMVEILKTRPERKYVELGTITVTGFAPAETAKMHNAIRTKSAKLGADAVILTEEGILPGGFGPKKWATGVAIHYSDHK